MFRTNVEFMKIAERLISAGIGGNCSNRLFNRWYRSEDFRFSQQLIQAI